MSLTRRMLRTVSILLVAGLVLAGCSGGNEDPGAKRMDSEAKELRQRVRETQIDR